jgi:glutathione S-transferase
MKLFYSPLSPFARKCLVGAHELGLRQRIEPTPVAAHPVNRDAGLVAVNPLGKVPALMIDDGTVLYDSRVICEFLNSLGDGHLLPQNSGRWAVLKDQALADGIMDAAVLTRYENAVRPENLRWSEWSAGQLSKVTSALQEFEQRAASFADRIDLGTIATGCALGYLDFRFADLAWRQRHPNLATWFERFGQRESMVATRPPPP